MGKAKNFDKEINKGFYLIETTLGSSIVPAAADIVVNLSDNLYIMKKVADTKSDEMVVFKKEGIEKTLEDIEPSLMKSPRYVSASESIHIFGPNGEMITRFRFDLINWFCEEKVLDKTSLEEKLFKIAGADFNDEDYDQIVPVVKNLLKNDELVNHDYTPSTIKKWLQGDTTAALDWNVFDALAKHYAAFEDYNKPKSEGGIKEDYKLYVTVRQGIMRYLSTKGSAKFRREKAHNESKESLSLKQEIDIVISDFMDDINEEYALARITSIRKLGESEEQKQKRERPERALHKGLVTKKIKEFGWQYSDYMELMGVESLLMNALGFAFHTYLECPQNTFRDYLSQTIKSRTTVFSSWDEMHEMVYDSLHMMEDFFRLDGIDTMKLRKRHKKHVEAGFEYNENVIRDAYNKLVNGEADRALGLKEGKLYQLFRTTCRAIKSVPERIRKYDQERFESIVSGRYTKQLKEEDEFLKKRYNVNTSQIKATLAGALKVNTQVLNMGYMTVMNNERLVAEFAKMYDPEYIFKKAEVEQILGRHDLSEFIRFFPKNSFVFG